MARSDRILALDIGASNLKLAEFQRLKGGGLQLSRYVVSSLGLDLDSDADRSRYIVTTLREMLAEHNIAPGPVSISVSGQQVFSRFVKLPVVSQDKIPQMVLYEAQQNVPFPIQEVVWDYQLVGGAQPGEELDVMLAAIKGDIIDELTGCVRFAGLEAELVDVAPMALYNTVRYNYGNLEGCTLLIDIGARATNLIFMEGTRVFSRSIPVAGNAITQQIMREFELSFSDAEDLKMAHAFVAFGGAYEAPASEVADKVSKAVRSVMTRMHAEINRSINFYRGQQSGAGPSLILLTGGSSIIGYTDTFLNEKLKVDVEYLNPFANVPVAPHVSAEEIGEVAHMMGEVVGLALRQVATCPIELDLMPPAILKEKAFKKKQPLLAMAMVGLVLTVLIWYGYFLKMTSIRQENLSALESEYNKLKADETKIIIPEKEIEATTAKIDTLIDLVGQRPRWLSMMDKIHTLLPEGMWLNSIHPVDKNGRKLPITVVPDKGPPGGSSNDGKTIEFVQISGYGYRDKIETPIPIEELLKKLQALPEFVDKDKDGAEASKITFQPTPGEKNVDVVREFTIRLMLTEPLKL